MTENEQLKQRGYSLQAVFIPTHYKKVKDMQVNWYVTLVYKDKPILSTDYHQGIGYLKGHKQGMTYPRVTVDIFNRLQSVLEGKNAYIPGTCPGPVDPDIADVLHCLLSDAAAIDYSTFEDWAGCYGYDTDSRKAEKIYSACLEIGLKLRNGLGEEELTAVREILQDY